MYLSFNLDSIKFLRIQPENPAFEKNRVQFATEPPHTTLLRSRQHFRAE